MRSVDREANEGRQRGGGLSVLARVTFGPSNPKIVVLVPVEVVAYINKDEVATSLCKCVRNSSKRGEWDEYCRGGDEARKSGRSGWTRKLEIERGVRLNTAVE